MPANVPRQHHHTPQVLLNGFTHNGMPSGKLYVTDLKRMKTYPSTPESTGTERDYNLLEGEGLDPFGVESELLARHIEGPAGPVFRKLRTGELLANEDEKMALLNFMAMQAIRGPSVRDAHDRFTTDVMRQVTALITESDDTFAAHKAAHPELEDLTREEVIEWSANTTVKWGPTGHLRAQLPSFGPIFDLLARRSWCLLIAPPDAHFVCTDNPVVFVPVGPRSPYAPRGFADPDPVLMPVGKGHALLGVFPPANTEPTWSSMVIDAAKVAAMNTCILAVASRFVAAPEDNFVWMRATGEISDRAAYVASVEAASAD